MLYRENNIGTVQFAINIIYAACCYSCENRFLTDKSQMMKELEDVAFKQIYQIKFNYSEESERKDKI